MKSALFPGSFDPFHQGHHCILNQALKVYERLYLIVSWNENKERLQEIDEVVEELQIKYQNNPSIVVLANHNKMTSQIAQDLNCFEIVRGYRNNDDLEYEAKLETQMKKQDERIRFVLFHCEEHKNLSSSSIKCYNAKETKTT